MRKNPGGSKGSIINTASFVAILGAATPQIACGSRIPFSRLSFRLELFKGQRDRTLWGTR